MHLVRDSRACAYLHRAGILESMRVVVVQEAAGGEGEGEVSSALVESLRLELSQASRFERAWALGVGAGELRIIEGICSSSAMLHSAPALPATDDPASVGRPTPSCAS